ncbi:hypothetical protein Tco_1111071 [Tanacetum coccineum]|uniref:Uncharacterized protein n=1 Tax=Tanacetum coccineum TaxID=301880 RepID=A0ABQ5IN18_9ASTR
MEQLGLDMGPLEWTKLQQTQHGCKMPRCPAKFLYPHSFLIAKMVAPLPLLEELASAVDSDVTKDQLSSELKAAVRRRDGYIAELRLYRSCDDTLGTIEMLSRMQLEDMEKAARFLLMARETQVKVDEKTGFIMRMRNRVVV